MKFEFELSENEFEQKLKRQTIISKKFINNAFNYVFSDSNEFRTPFPEYIRDELSYTTFRLFMEYAFKIKDNEIDKIRFSEKFNEILIKVGLSLVKSEDERVSICYPFLPRVGDVAIAPNNKESIVRNRELITKKGKKILRIYMIAEDTKQVWDSDFALN